MVECFPYTIVECMMGTHVFWFDLMCLYDLGYSCMEFSPINAPHSCQCDEL